MEKERVLESENVCHDRALKCLSPQHILWSNPCRSVVNFPFRMNKACLFILNR